LNDGDDIWVYFPRTNRTRKIASSARNRRVQGSDFTYDDMASGKMAKSWKGKVLGTEERNGVSCYKLGLKPTKSGPKSYSKVTAWVDKSNYTAVSIVYYDLDGEKTKRLDISGYKKIDKVMVPHKYTMTNLIDGGKTVMKVKKAEVNLRLKPGLFTEAGLGR
jgi:outer membrane lipoprotein-sorting protein